MGGTGKSEEVGNIEVAEDVEDEFGREYIS